ncbi:MAG: ABC transporter permease [Anaerolineae bacterium]|nr:ABC transporter permease [Anaerolineae bacterium]
MLKYVIKRILMGIPVLFAIVVVTFALAYALPGGPFDSSNQRPLPPHIRAQLEQKFGLQKPVFFNLPDDGSGSETVWGDTFSVKGYVGVGFTEQRFERPAGAGIRLLGEYDLIDNGAPNCLGQRSEPGWALLARRQECVVTGGNVNQTFAEVRERWSLDLFDAQFWIYLGNVLQLDFGPSLNLANVQENRQVIDEIQERVPVSIQLGVFATLIGFGLGIPLGVAAAAYHNTLIDQGLTFFAVLGASIPGIVLAPILILIFAVELSWLPVADPLVWQQGSSVFWPYVRAFLLSFFWLVFVLRLVPDFWHWMLRRRMGLQKLGGGLGLLAFAGALFWLGLEWMRVLEGQAAARALLPDYSRALVLPVLTIGLGASAGIARLTRASLLQVLNEDYIRTAQAKGLRDRTILYLHALKNSMIPVVTSLGGVLVGIVSGSFIVELIFSIPGMGDISIIAVNARDYTMIIGVNIFYSSLLILGNILVDVVYTWLDPRIRLD